MAAISPTGFQNHIQGPLASVIAAIMQGTFQNAREARASDREKRRDTERVRERDIDTALKLALAGGRGISGKFQGQPEFDQIRAAEGIGSAREQQMMADRAMQGEDRAMRQKLNAVQLRQGENEATWNSPFMRGVRGAGSEVSKILQAAIRKPDAPAAKPPDWEFASDNGQQFRRQKGTGVIERYVPKTDQWVPMGARQAPMMPAGVSGSSGAPEPMPAGQPPAQEQPDELGGYFERLLGERGAVRGGAFPSYTR